MSTQRRDSGVSAAAVAEALLAAMPDAAIVVEPDGTVVFASESTEALLGWAPSELVGRSVELLIPADAKERHARLREGFDARGARPMSPARELCARHRDGREVPVDVALSPLPREGRGLVLAVVRDVSHRVEADRRRAELEAELTHARRMESLGRLAAGLAHDLNNMLVAVEISSDLLEGELTEDIHRELVADIRGAGQRAAGLARQLLAFGRRRAESPGLHDLNDVISEQWRTLRRLMPEDISLDLASCGRPATVYVDRTQLEQVVLNLALNARDAMPHGGSARIRVDVVAADAVPDEARGPGEWVRLRVSDEGEGVPVEIRRRIFDPFFTTKSGGHGLGLATVDAIVRRSGGVVRVEGEAGRGATFEVFLPLRREAPAARDDDRRGAPPTRRATVLVVEDEPLTLRAIARHLAHAGFEVLSAESAAEARRVAAAHRGAIDVLLADVVIPDDTGPRLAAVLREARPGLAVVFTSGHDEAQARRRGLGEHDRLLRKPFDAASLLRALRTATVSAER